MLPGSSALLRLLYSRGKHHQHLARKIQRATEHVCIELFAQTYGNIRGNASTSLT
jgi:hypothetical protein